MDDEMKAAYGEVIDLIARDELNYRAMCLAIAKAAPKVFLDAVRLASPNKEESIKQHMIEFIRSNPGQKVAAIREHRGLTGMGLKESKDYCDDLILLVEMGSRKAPSVVDFSALDLDFLNIRRDGPRPPDEGTF